MSLRYYDRPDRDPAGLVEFDRLVPPLDQHVASAHPAPRRDGNPLPARTAADLVGQLVYRTLGPKYGKAKAFTDYILSGDTVSAISDRHHVDRKSINRWHCKVRDAGIRQPFTNRIWLELHTGIATAQGVNLIATTRARDILGWQVLPAEGVAELRLQLDESPSVLAE